MLTVRLEEHNQALKRGDPKSGIVVHAHESHNVMDWVGTTVKTSVSGYWPRKIDRGHPHQNERGPYKPGQRPTAANCGIILNPP